MKRFIKRMLITVSAAGMLLAPVAFAGAASAQSTANVQGNLCAGANLNVDDTSCSDTSDAPEKVNSLIALVINIFSIVVGVVSVIMIIIGGLKYITSGGDSGNVSGAKNTILYAIIGLVIVALAQVIVNFVLERAINAGT